MFMYTYTHTDFWVWPLLTNHSSAISYYVKNDCMFIVLGVYLWESVLFSWGELWGMLSACMLVASLSILKMKERNKGSEDMRPLASPALLRGARHWNLTLWVPTDQAEYRPEFPDMPVLRTSLLTSRWCSSGEAGDHPWWESWPHHAPLTPPGSSRLQSHWEHFPTKTGFPAVRIMERSYVFKIILFLILLYF